MKSTLTVWIIGLAWVASAHATSVLLPSVKFANLKNGDQVVSPVKVQFKVIGMKVKPAGTTDKRTGHHHLIVDGDAIPQGTVVPMDATHLHFGKGQTETSVELAPGKHKLTLQFADGAHVSYGPELSKTIEIEVKAAQ